MDKKLRIITLQIFASIVLFDVIVAIFMQDRARRAFPLYLNFAQHNQAEHGRGYPRFHFTNHPTRGFDISKSTGRILTSSKPAEGIPYYVWGNSIGCFDTEPNNTAKYQVYLAGDSFTWGYAPFDKKFGTILEKKLGLKIAKCGVTHTGQLHQFNKFKEISDTLGYYPKIVIVNIVSNDVDNDYFFPHSRVIDGYQVEDIEWRRLENGEIQVRRLSDSDLQNKYEKFKQDKKQIPTTNPLHNLRQYDPRRFSATIIVAGELVEVIRDFFQKDQFIRSPYGVKDEPAEANEKPILRSSYSTSSKVSASNLNAINQWITHSKSNGYRLIFSLIPRNPRKIGYDYSELKKFITKADGEVYDFSEHIRLTPYADKSEELYWQIDSHFNEAGNAVYADHLHKIISRN